MIPVSTERGPRPPDVEHVALEADPLTIEKKEAVTPIPVKFPAQVNDDQGVPLIETPEGKKIEITIPADEEELDRLSKGSSENTVTWFARFWKRMIKKATSLGWSIIKPRGDIR